MNGHHNYFKRQIENMIFQEELINCFKSKLKRGYFE